MQERTAPKLHARHLRIVLLAVAALFSACGTTTGSANIPTFTAGVTAAPRTAASLPTSRPAVTAQAASTDTARTAAPTVPPTAPPTPPPTTAAPTPAPATPAPTQAPARATAAPANTCGAAANPWGYTFCGGSFISSPPANFCSYFNCIASFWNGVGYVMQCADATFSKSGGRSGSCSSHGGNSRALYAP